MSACISGILFVVRENNGNTSIKHEAIALAAMRLQGSIGIQAIVAGGQYGRENDMPVGNGI